MKCQKCKGTGIEYRKRWKPRDKSYTSICTHCNGKKELDWVDNIFGDSKNGMSKV